MDSAQRSQTGLGGIVDPDRVADVCRRYGIATLMVFGSVARGDVNETSDIDLLYELRSGARLGWEVGDLVDDLSEVFGRRVDLVSRTAVHPRLRAAIFDEARPVYAA